MSSHLTRVTLLLRQNRLDLAEQELRRVLLENPQDVMALGLLATCLVEQKRYDEATRAAQEAIVADPEEPLGHYTLAIVLRHRHRLDAAAKSVMEAIRLAPDQTGQWAELAQIELNRENWNAALEAAEQGLLFDAEDVDCNNLRAVALVKLGRRAEAGQTIDAALARDPDNAVTHANYGWTLLEARQPKEAMGHFREALRLDPNLAWARAGIAEAMKARNPLYRWLLAYFLWLAKLDYRVRMGLIIGLWVLVQLLDWLGRSVPAVEPLITPLLIAYAIFALTTWIGVPLANLILRLDRFGRFALSDDQIRSSNLVGLTLIMAAGCLVYALTRGNEDVQSVLLIDTLYVALLVIPVSAVHSCDAGPPRHKMMLIAGGLSLFALTAYLTHALAFAGSPLALQLGIKLKPLMQIYPWGILGASFAANALSQQVVRR